MVKDIEALDTSRIRDLLETIEKHCKIGYILINLQHDDLLPSILEDIAFFAQELEEYFIDGE